MYFLLALAVCLLLYCSAQKSGIKSAKELDESAEYEIKYDNKDEMDEKIKKLHKKRSREAEKAATGLDDGKLGSAERMKLEKEENQLRRTLLETIDKHGKSSKATADVLHKLGRSVYLQMKFDEALKISKSIVKIHEDLDGEEDIKTADALGNLASVANRLGDKDVCAYAMYRALYILIQKYGMQSKEVLRHRAKMLTFQIRDGESSRGLSYEDATEEYDHIEL